MMGTPYTPPWLSFSLNLACSLLLLLLLLLLPQMYQVSVINMSLGIYRASLTEGLAGTLCDIVRQLEAAGIVVVCAASEQRSG
jgi:hypothetical protein